MATFESPYSHNRPEGVQASACNDGSDEDGQRMNKGALHEALDRIGWPRTANALALALVTALCGCASLSSGNESQSDDPLEPLNRTVFDLNTELDTAIIRPVAEAYRSIVPEFARDRIRSFIDNLAEPRIFANDVLQGRFNAAGYTFARFTLNTFAGIGGLFDVATKQGMPKQTGDFGETLYMWGVDSGPYVVLLLFGPSNVRDAFGLGVDLYTTPPSLIVTGHAGTVTNIVVGTVDGMDLRARNIETLDEIKASALDYYTHMKSIVRQHRDAQLRDARGVKEEPQELTDPGAPKE